MFEVYIKKKYNKCHTQEEYMKLREELEAYGIERFYYEMERRKIFKDGRITQINNPFSQIISGEKGREHQNYYEFILLKKTDSYYLLIPKLLEWDSFNVLTLGKKHIYLLKRMKNLALEFVKEKGWEEYSLFFHCHPFNSVQTLHLHITDKPMNNKNDLDIDIVLDTLQRF